MVGLLLLLLLLLFVVAAAGFFFSSLLLTPTSSFFFFSVVFSSSLSFHSVTSGTTGQQTDHKDPSPMHKCQCGMSMVIWIVPSSANEVVRVRKF